MSFISYAFFFLLAIVLLLRLLSDRFGFRRPFLVGLIGASMVFNVDRRQIIPGSRKRIKRLTIDAMGISTNWETNESSAVYRLGMKFISRPLRVFQPRTRDA